MKPLPWAAPALALLASWSAPLLGGEGPSAEADALTCNQLAREIALRAAEAELGLDARRRQRLREIAEAACLDYSMSGSAAIAATPAGEDALAGAEEEGEGYRPFSDIQVIDPQDRVRRPGLKRR